jgi:hypothetical protein
MKTTILRTLHYPLPATTLTQKQCDASMAPILHAGLPCSGIEEDITGQLIRASTRMDQPKLTIGCNGPTLSLPYAEFAGLATKCWLQQTWQYMDAYQMRIEDTSPDFLLSRANDKLLIPLFYEHEIRGHQLHRINLCRLYLQVLTNLDITTGCGTKITTTAWNGEQDTKRKFRYQWPT